jgi:hypothetical protein
MMIYDANVNYPALAILVENQIFNLSLESVWEETVAYFSQRDRVGRNNSSLDILSEYDYAFCIDL